MNKMSDNIKRQKICDKCGKIIDINETCSCLKNLKNDYQKQYYKKNKNLMDELTSLKWAKFRKLIIDRDNGYCQRCYYKYGIINKSNLQVHHIKPRIKYPNLVYDENNCITLCKTCNTQLGLQEELDFIWNKKELNYNL